MRTPLHTFPLATWLLGLPGVVMLPPGLWLTVADAQHIHPLLDGPWAGIALVVSATALIGSAAFPLVLRRLAATDEPAPHSHPLAGRQPVQQLQPTDPPQPHAGPAPGSGTPEGRL